MQEVLPATCSIEDVFVFCNDNAPAHHQHIVLVTQSSICAVRRRQSWYMTIQHSWPKLGWFLHLGYDPGVCNCVYQKYQLRDRDELWQWLNCWDGHGLNISTAWWMMQLIRGIQD